MWQANRPLESITFEHIEATDISMPLTVYGDVQVPVTLNLHDVKVSLREGFENIDFIHACNYEKLSIKNVVMKNYRGNSFIKTWSDGQIEIENLDCMLEEENIIVKAKEKFYAKTV